jgi:hypothetical protein
MTGVVATYMSSSTYAIDSAWSHLQDDDKIEKILPLVPLAIGAGFGALGAYSGAGGKIYDSETGEWFTNPFAEGAGPAYLQDPFTGGLALNRELGTSAGARALGAGVGAFQALNPATYVGLAGKGLRGASALSRRRKLTEAADAGKDAYEVAIRTGKTVPEAKQASIMAQERVLQPGVKQTTIQPGVIDSTLSPVGRIRQDLGRGVGATGRGLERIGASKLARFAGRGAQLYGQAKHQGIGDAAAAFLGRLALTQLPDYNADFAGIDASRFSPQTQASAFGAGAGATGGFGQGYGMQDLTNVSSNRMGEDAIWTGTAAPFQGQQGRGVMAERTVADTGKFGGFNKGDNMKIGERMLKDVTELMHKAHCVGAVKEDTCPKDCPGCPKCEGENKKKADKKPAHGMVIVIGSKAGPGPSKDGKREKVDSEKKEE